MAFLLVHLIFFLFPFLSSAAPSPSSASPFTEKAALIRYWNRKIPNNLPHPSFLLSKLTPLSPSAAATFFSLASSDPALLSSHLASFCSAAGLLCPSDSAPTLASHPNDSDFKGYENGNFSNYGRVNSAGGVSSFKNYSENFNDAADTFRRYGRHDTAHDDKFTLYGRGSNVHSANFTSYGTNTALGTDNFAAYDESTNVRDLEFTNYEAHGAGRSGIFSQYSMNGNGGGQSFSGYGKDANVAVSDFSSYGNESNVIGSTFANYGEQGNGDNDTFFSYGENGNSPEENFRSYGESTTGGTDKFTGYRDNSNVGDSFFASYEKGGNEGAADFTNYGHSANPGSESFKGYGEGSFNDQITFKEYFAGNTSFKAYANTSTVDFKGYHNSSFSPGTAAEDQKQATANRWVEPGKFFREKSLRKGTVMPMPDIRDRMAPRSFLPRSIASKIPFSASAVDGIFRILPDTAMGKAVESTLADCERAPSRGETKRCAASAEDMIDFAVVILGKDIEVRSTASTTGSNGDILIGDVRGVNGGKVTESVSCHQSLFPYLVYYCHSVPRVRVYIADILAVESKEKINKGVAICHIDTSDWSPTHGAFVALGPGPGKIEVCHWIFEGDMTWTVADRA